ncbi:histone demethylase Jmj2 [Schizosaccharomyces cryophilus OY26]|uniref:Histone demethylase Jmj2 n=1 Tax=Schizosaccharomyces cryophilus (strain OY26 / ATCC MYA-4695 / CBS 11777 / NBRC 106824 / NRRL Y48691) TaxID=653667 RepID=S9XID1_SCHCR|nr:histone demethylase Jmj2 [Schizosaccharomyces cryophilus OY26]EPY53421.1 histone demethylase Jmj2 [Schizosaccharomyces cryophilus OY26]
MAMSHSSVRNARPTQVAYQPRSNETLTEHIRTRRSNARSLEKSTINSHSHRNRTSALGLPPAPTFYPSDEEFKDAIHYIQKITPIAKDFGIVKIVPPSGWKPTFELDMDKFSFRARRQDLRMMDLEFREAAAYDERIFRYFCNKNIGLPQTFIVSNTSVDLYQIRRSLELLGFSKGETIPKECWKEILVSMNLPDTSATEKEIQSIYSKYIAPFEAYISTLSSDVNKYQPLFTKVEDQELLDIDKSSRKQKTEASSSNGILDLDSEKANAHKQENTINRSTRKRRAKFCESCQKKIDFSVECLGKESYCTECILTPHVFGFEMGDKYTLSEFERKCDDFKTEYFSKFDSQTPITDELVEAEYWKLVKSKEEAYEVEYGADLSTMDKGSAFPHWRKKPKNPYSRDPWNLNVLASSDGSLLRFVENAVSGITSPWLYIGMCFSTFCWHVEDNYTYSANYQHSGETKLWYGIPGNYASKFEEAARHIAPDLANSQPDLLYQLAAMVNPKELTKRGVKVYYVDQAPNEFVITLPKCFHGGINLGFNINEAVNFAPKNWLLDGYSLEGALKYRSILKPTVLSHDRLLYKLATKNFNLVTYEEILPCLREAVEREQSERSSLREQYHLKEALVRELLKTDEQWQCAYCNAYSYFSKIVCLCTPLVACTKHIEKLCDCKPEKKTLQLRIRDTELLNLLNLKRSNTS